MNTIITHPEKIYFPATENFPSLTKFDIINYYQTVADLFLPSISNRFITVQRFLYGIQHKSFYQKRVPSHFPSYIDRIVVKTKSTGNAFYLSCNNRRSLTYLCNQGCITYHRWLSKINDINKPDMMIFDLDPSDPYDIMFEEIKLIALDLKQALAIQGFESSVMTTGSRGLHVISEIKPKQSFDAIRALARTIASEVSNKNPNLRTINNRKEHRKHKILIDIMRNSFGATAVAPYSIRGIPGAPIAMPIQWEELSTLKSAQQYTAFSFIQKI